MNFKYFLSIEFDWMKKLEIDEKRKTKNETKETRITENKRNRNKIYSVQSLQWFAIKISQLQNHPTPKTINKMNNKLWIY